MFSSAHKTRYALALALAVPACAMAQHMHGGHGAAAPHRPAASAPAASRPATNAPPRQDGYSSAFDGHRAFGDEAARPWREANDTVGRIGGWRAYARESEPATTTEPAERSQGKGGLGAHVPR